MPGGRCCRNGNGRSKCLSRRRGSPGVPLRNRTSRLDPSPTRPWDWGRLRRPIRAEVRENGFLPVYRDKTAVLPESGELTLVRYEEPLQRERCAEPRPVEFGDEHPELDILDRNNFQHLGFHCAGRVSCPHQPISAADAGGIV